MFIVLYVDRFDCLLPRKGQRGARRPEALVPPQRERRAGDHPGSVQGRLRAHTSPLVLCYMIISPDAVFVCCSLPRRGCVPCVSLAYYINHCYYIHSSRARPAAWTCRTTPRRTFSWRCGWAGEFAFDVVSRNHRPFHF